jgi:hypothetical protein
MKIVFLAFSVATLLGLAFIAGGFPFDAGVFISSCFVTALLAWTIVQYRHKVRPLVMTRPIHLRVRLARPEPRKSPEFNRLAA